MYVYTGRKLALWLANFHSSAFRCSSGTQQYLVRTLSINKYVTSLFFRPFEQPHYIQCYKHSFDLLFVIVREIVIYMQIMQIVCLFDSSFECPRNKMLSHINKYMHSAHTQQIYGHWTFVSFWKRIYYIWLTFWKALSQFKCSLLKWNRRQFSLANSQFMGSMPSQATKYRLFDPPIYSYIKGMRETT